jgi:hypothetical protein
LPSRSGVDRTRGYRQDKPSQTKKHINNKLNVTS